MRSLKPPPSISAGWRWAGEVGAAGLAAAGVPGVGVAAGSRETGSAAGSDDSEGPQARSEVRTAKDNRRRMKRELAQRSGRDKLGPMNEEPPALLSTTSEVELLVEHLLDEPRYALDTEFLRERTYYAKLALVQIAWSGGVALIDPLTTAPEALKPLLEGKGLAVIHAASQDLEILAQDCGAVPSRVFDTQIAAAFVGLGRPSLAKLTQELLDVSLSKAEQLADWTRRPLSPAALRYAAADVTHLLPLHDALSARLETLERDAFCGAECEEQRTASLAERPDEQAWWRIKGSRSMSRRSQGVAQEVAAWRVSRARQQDKPLKWVLSDMALLGVIQRAPKNLGALRKIRGFEGRALHDDAAQSLLEAVRRGEELSDDAVCRPPERDGHKPSETHVALAMAWLTERARQISIEPSVLATRSDVEEFVASRAGRLAHGHRHRVIGVELDKLLDGRLALTCDPDGGLKQVELSAS